MQRLTGLDASFLYLETPTSHMHVAGLDDPRPVDGARRVRRSTQVRDIYAQRLAPRAAVPAPARRGAVRPPPPAVDRGPRLRPRLPPAPHRRAAPGGRGSSPSSSSQIVADPLDRSRPLWEMWVIEGLEDGNVAVLTKVHHAAIDGVSGDELTVAMLDLEPEPARRRRPEHAWEPDRVPTDIELLGYAARSLARQPIRAAQGGSAHRTRRAARTSVAQPRQPDVDAAAGAVHRAAHVVQRGASRRTAASRIAVAVARRREGGEERARRHGQRRRAGAVRAARCAATSTTHGEQPDGPLVAMVPVSVRTEDQKARCGNQVSIDARVARHRHRRPGRAAPGDPRGMSRRKEQQNAIGRRHAAGLGRVRRRRRVFGRAARALLADRSWPTATGRSSTSRSRTCPARRSRSTRRARDGGATTRWARSSTAPGSTSR